MNNNLENMKCSDLRIMAKNLGIKEYGNKGKGWLIPRIEEVLKVQEEAKKAEAKKAEPKKVSKNAVVYEFNGKTQTIGKWAKELGIPVGTLRARIRKGWSIEETLGKASSETKEKPIEFNGKSQNLTAWSRELGIPRPTLAARLYRLNWTPAKAFTRGAIIG